MKEKNILKNILKICKKYFKYRTNIVQLRCTLTSFIPVRTNLLINPIAPFWGVVSAAVEQSRRRANMVAQGVGKFGP